MAPPEIIILTDRKPSERESRGSVLASPKRIFSHTASSHRDSPEDWKAVCGMRAGSSVIDQDPTFALSSNGTLTFSASSFLSS